MGPRAWNTASKIAPIAAVARTHGRGWWLALGCAPGARGEDYKRKAGRWLVRTKPFLLLIFFVFLIKKVFFFLKMNFIFLKKEG